MTVSREVQPPGVRLREVQPREARLREAPQAAPQRTAELRQPEELPQVVVVVLVLLRFLRGSFSSELAWQFAAAGAIMDAPL